MVERNVLVSNLVSFLDAATSVIIWPPLKGCECAEGNVLGFRMKNAEEGREQQRVGEQNCDPPDEIMISRLGSEVNTPEHW
jgi:hypothetical protein